MKKNSSGQQPILHKIKAKFKKLGLSLPILALIILVFSSIVIIAIIQSERLTLFSRAATTCPPGVGTYMQQAGCEQICGVGKCKSCTLVTTTKYYCDAPLGSGTKPGSGGYNLPTCSGYSTNVKSACEAQFGAGNCTQCTVDGSNVRWHQSKGQTQPPSNSKKCKVSGGPQFPLGTTVCHKDKLYSCENAQNGVIAKYIGPCSVQPTSSVLTSECTNSNLGKQCVTYSGSSTYGKCAAGFELGREYFYCKPIGQLPLSPTTIPTVTTKQASTPVLTRTLTPTPIPTISKTPPSIPTLYPRMFLYPQTTIQQTITGLVTTSDGLQIDCNVNICTAL